MTVDRKGRGRWNPRRCVRWMLIVLGILLVLEQSVGRLMGLGYHLVTTSGLERHPSPYDMFRGRPKAEGRVKHNEFGFRGPFPRAEDLPPGTFTIAFFGGSTGYNGTPPIPDLIAANLEKKGIKTVSYNFSSAASMHTAHLHRLLSFVDRFQFDAVVFYGGANEGLVPLIYDPRPGYPLDFFVKQELDC